MAGVSPGTAPALSSRRAGGTGRGAALSTVDVEARTQQLGRALLAAAERYRPGPAERVQDWLLTHDRRRTPSRSVWWERSGANVSTI